MVRLLTNSPKQKFALSLMSDCTTTVPAFTCKSGPVAPALTVGRKLGAGPTRRRYGGEPATLIGLGPARFACGPLVIHRKRRQNG
jgi:hypothetical protein